MRQKPGFNIRVVCGENIIVGEGESNIDFNNIISMNDSSAYLWNSFKGKEFTAETLAKALTDEYEVDEATALADSKEVLKQWIDAGIVE